LDLDGVQWSETARDHVAKAVRRGASGEPVIPLALHEQKMGEQAKALGHESLNMWEARTRPSEVLQEQFVVEGVFPRHDVFSEDKARVLDVSLVICACDTGVAVWPFQALLRHSFTLHNTASTRDFSSLGFKLLALSRSCKSVCLVYGVSLHA
jgi:hypothetical protein